MKYPVLIVIMPKNKDLGYDLMEHLGKTLIPTHFKWTRYKLTVKYACKYFYFLLILGLIAQSAVKGKEKSKRL